MAISNQINLLLLPRFLGIGKDFLDVEPQVEKASDNNLAQKSWEAAGAGPLGD